MHTPRLMAVLAHPDDESLGVGGTLAKYASEGVDVFLLTATRGDGGRYRGHRPDDPQHPGPLALAKIREAELRAAAAVLGVREVSLLDYHDQHLDRADPREAVARIVGHLRRVRPDVVVTFGPDGAYGHPDHIAISQFTTAAIVAAADPAFAVDGGDGDVRPHAVSKLYYIAWPASTWAAYQAAVGTLFSTVDGVERQATPWPDWAITTVIDTRDFWSTVWRAISCHESQVAAYERLKDLSPEHHEALWGRQSFYRAFSTVNGGRARETDLFEGIPSERTIATKESGVDSDSIRHSPLAMDAATFRALGHRLVDQLAEFLESLPRGPVTRDESPSAVRDALDLTGPLPESGMDPGPLLERTAQLLFDHSLFNGHPRFFGYITAPPAPIGILGDFLAAAVNPNVGAWTLSPAATEIESQTVRWIAALIGYPVDCGGLLVSGGNMANLVCFMAARAAKAGWDVREHGVAGESGRTASRLRLGRNAHVDSEGRRPWRASAPHRSGGSRPTPGSAWTSTPCAGRSKPTSPRAIVPCLVVGTAGSVSTGAVDPLPRHRRALQGVRASGFTSMAPTAALRRPFPRRPMTCAG